MVEIYYLDTAGRTVAWKCSEERLELFLEKLEYKGLQVIDWVYL